jgi:hypothetical protein
MKYGHKACDITHFTADPETRFMEKKLARGVSISKQGTKLAF